jgi:hypothetical protein
MPIPVVCESCNAKLNAPDAAAGKSLKCPKCKGAITVPDPAAAQFEVVDEEPAAPPKAKLATPAKKKPVVVEDEDEDEKPKAKKKKPVLIEEDDDEDEKPKAKKKKPVLVEEDDDDEEDDDEEDDKPRKKKKKKKVVSAVDSGNMARTIIGIVVLLIALGFAAYVWWDRSKEKEKNEKTENSAGWTRHSL